MASITTWLITSTYPTLKFEFLSGKVDNLLHFEKKLQRRNITVRNIIFKKRIR